MLRKEGEAGLETEQQRLCLALGCSFFETCEKRVPQSILRTRFQQRVSWNYSLSCSRSPQTVGRPPAAFANPSHGRVKLSTPVPFWNLVAAWIDPSSLMSNSCSSP